MSVGNGGAFSLYLHPFSTREDMASRSIRSCESLGCRRELRFAWVGRARESSRRALSARSGERLPTLSKHHDCRCEAILPPWRTPAIASINCKAISYVPKRRAFLAPKLARRGPSALNQGALVVRYRGTSIRSITYSTLPKLSAPIPTRWEHAKWPHLRGPSLIAGRHVFPMEASSQSQSSSSALG